MLVLFLLFGVLSAAPDLENLKGMCRLEPHPSVEYRCLVSDGEGHRPCNAYEPADTIVIPKCRKPNYYSTTSLPFMRCFEGYWDYIARCTPECGRLTPEGEKLVAGGHSVKRGELPWHAGIYKKTRSPYLQVCGGSLISTNVVVSAAHCFWNDLEKQLPAFQYAVAVGKVYRQWNNNLDEAQKSNVKAIHLPHRFQGASANFQEDIAVVIVSREFKYKTYIRPVCLSFDYDFENLQLQAGNTGKVAGWGLTAANGKPATQLQALDMPYVDVGTCIAKSPPLYRGFITGDKICAGTLTPDTALCKGDSGGGLVFPETYRQVERYYLRGVVSTAPSSDDACNTETYTSFTQLIKHEHFIKQFWTETGQFKCLDGSFITAANHCDGATDCADGSDETARACSRKTCSSYLFQCKYGACVDKGAICNEVKDCADGSDETEKLCGKSTAKPEHTVAIQVGNRCLLPPYPEHGSYVVTNIAGGLPGQIYDLVTLNITCEAGFRILGSGFIYCFKGQWLDSMPECTNEFRNDYTYYTRAGGWFKVHPVPVDWRTAGLICHHEGAELVTPRKPELVAVLKELIAKAVPRQQVYYSGVRQRVVDKANELGISLKHEYAWDIDEQNTLGYPEQCLVYSSDAVERDFNCDDPLPYICYRRFRETDVLTECGTVDNEYKLDTNTEHCYKLHTHPQSWERGMKICRAEGGYLAIINSAEEARSLSELVPQPQNGSVAVGIREWGAPDSWWTVNGQTLEEAGFEEWCDGCPNSILAPGGIESRRACGGLLDGKLEDISCDTPQQFICEKTKEFLSMIK